MGCDIHLLIEYKKVMSDWVQSFSRDKINISRNYGLFAVLADVRNDYDIQPVCQQKGFPKEISYEADKLFGCLICDNQTEDYKYEDGYRYISLSHAQDILKKGYVFRINDRYVSNSDHHSHSWLNLPELKKAYELYQNRFPKEKTITEIEAIISVMETFEKNDYVTRVIFAFDN